jgi:hypothetical protein
MKLMMTNLSIKVSFLFLDRERMTDEEREKEGTKDRWEGFRKMRANN